MTTTLENASLDDLLSFLRSDSPPPKRAASRTATARTARAERRPSTPIEAATLRRPPLASERYRAATREARRAGNYQEERRHHDHAATLRRVECRLVAWLVSKALGPQWRFEPADDDHRCHHIVHRATTATLAFRNAWRDESRYEIVPENVHRTDTMPRSITVSGERSPAAIAADIERRLIGAGLFDQNAAHLSAGHERRAQEVKDRREVLAIAQAFGGTLATERHWKHQNEPRSTTGHFGPRADDYGDHRVTQISAATSYHGLELSIYTNNVQLAIKVAELVRSHYAS